ncbi:glycosyltransferase 36 associated family protein [Collimonas arenae]|uniref:Glycosyltransferase 36 associated family protein n=1 Tax=Collimonas arenae TaxID=279058 RepID=A0A127QJC1_9BURK|nr:glycosyltransferase 36 associated family protein [Collimonas arenae]
MKSDNRSLRDHFLVIKNALLPGSANGQSPSDELPLRAELFSALQMEQHGRILANAHKLSTERGRDQLLSRLASNENVIIDACSQLTEAIKASRQVTPAAEWLLDNFYLIEEQIRTAKRHLPKNYSRELPRLLRGSSAGRPRVYDIALETISHGDGRVDPESLSRFVAAYQQVTPLKLGELWAIPIMLRLALIENLRRVAANLALTRLNRNLADSWADAMAECAENDPSNLILLVADMARSEPPLDSSFVAELVRRVQGQSPALTLPMTWLSQRLAESGQTIEQLVQLETQQQAADQVSISNSIGSLRFLSAMDWREFVETMSVVDHTLRKDPVDVYARMDFATRDRYRHVIEKIAKHGRLSEFEVADSAVRLASAHAPQDNLATRQAHVGYYLVGEGLPELEQSAGFRSPPLQALQRAGKVAPLSAYLVSMLVITLLVAFGIAAKAYADGTAYWIVALIAVMALIGASQLAHSMVNWLITLVATPHPLPRMDFSDGIPVESSTLVVVPTILFTKQNIDNLSESLEVRYLANRDDNLRFCLLTDFADADTETMPDDAALLEHTKQHIDDLNKKYNRSSHNNFLLLHRPRRWNPQEKTWMGYERKRGKLADLNALLRGGVTDNFSLIVGNILGLSNIKYVITLDTDTELPRDTARQFVATLAHPLNCAVFDARRRRVVQGYGILQPRVAVSLPSAEASRYELLCGGETGIDPYTRTVSDVYQDVFGEGSFVGKGIYDVDAFEQALKNRMPENRVLSHDLLEGCYARAGLLSDVQLYEQYPSRYSADITRRHRWIRGDWQIASWLLPRVPGPRDAATGKIVTHRNPLSALSRWKLFDNLRRSVVPFALTALLLIGWTALPAAWFWSSAMLGILLLPSICTSLLSLIRKPSDVLLRQHLSASLRATTQHFIHAVLNLIFLPYEAAVNLDAILRTQWRILVSHKKLLAWNPSSEANRQSNNSLVSYYQLMWIAPTIAFVTAAYLVIRNPLALSAAAPILLLWWVSPFIAYWISQPIARRHAQLSGEQILFLKSLSRKTWHFFETYVGPEDNWLPLDNVQEHPVTVVARRTSPTNIGLSLLANLTAYDFGYIPPGQLIERTQNTFQTMASLERYQGHFYNWYDTQYLKPLHPIYVSTVDSGNLAGHLLTLRPGLNDLLDTPIFNPIVFSGIRDTYEILRDTAGGGPLVKLIQFEKDLESACQSVPATLTVAHDCLARLSRCATGFVAGLDPVPDTQINVWARALASQCREALNELEILTPWISALASSEWVDDFPRLDQIPTLRQLAQLHINMMPALSQRRAAHKEPQRSDYLSTLDKSIADGSRQAVDRMLIIEQLMTQATDFARMEYSFLYDPATHLLAIGYNVSERRRDVSFYDLLASEARLTTFVAIAQGQLPQESWFALGRQLTIAGSEPILLSWSGSMFEYLMPLLVMPTFENTLLDQTYGSAVKRQIEYGMQRGVPWGISESGYNTFDASLNYQYRAFGVPGLGFKRGLGDDLVIAPYASMMALMVAPEEACRNLQQMSAEGFEGEYGFFEAIDYTPSRLPRGQTNAVIRSFMAHHQGMGFLALSYLLLDRPMQKRFESDPLFQATMSLLHERVPKASATYSNTTELADIRTTSAEQGMQMRVLQRPDPRTPEVQLLSNGHYHVMITSAGGSRSRWNDLSITRWREDSTRDNWGTFCYVRELDGADNGIFWSTAYQPTRAQPDNYEVIFSEGRAEFRRRDNNFDMHTEIVVSQEDDIELRRTRIVNRSRMRRTIDVTSYAEVVLAPAAADDTHPAFSNLFVQTEIVHSQRAILCTRRPRSMHEKMPWMFHLLAVHGVDIGTVSYETDRMQFIGRGNTVATAQAMRLAGPLAGNAGSVLDPIVAIRYQITLEAEQTATIDMVTGIGDSREVCLGLIDKYQDRHLADRVVELSWPHSQVVLRQLNASEADAQLYGRLASSVIYVNSLLRADASVLIRNHRGQSGLWGYAISGDLPIVLVRLKSQENIELVRQLVQAHAYWRSKGLAVDLVIWNEDHAGYRQLLQEQIMGLISSVTGSHEIDRPGGIFVRLVDQISDEDRILLQSVARVVLSDSRGTLAEQLNRRDLLEIRVPRLAPARVAALPEMPQALPTQQRDLILANGVGGFTPDGREYVITTSANQLTPAPWGNVIANAQFGTVISESGQAYTWGENAHEFRLTPWADDPVTDEGGEVFYLRDEESGHYWSPTPLPSRGAGEYVTRHGFGYSVFEHVEDGIASELTVYVALDASIKYSILKVSNASDTLRKLSATGYVEWVLGDLRPKSTMHIITESDPATGALFARNPYNTEFTDRTAFFDVDTTTRSITGDRNEFIGRNGSLQHPAAMARVRLSGKVGASLDPCAAMQVQFDLNPGQQREIVFIFGMADTRQTNVSNLVQRYRGTSAAHDALQAVHAFWAQTLGTVQVDTPDPALNVLANGWLMYQTIACRMWARSGYYQSGGAFGFRDQLQDAMALVHSQPQLVRAHLLLCAAHQFIEGDVQHWWHPPTDRGVRTHCSDDYLWLPLAVHRYVSCTGDHTVLQELAPFLEGRAVNPDEDSYYDLPSRSTQSATLYQHCVRTIERGLQFGVHGLPLMGSCDWNDGMDKVGEHGKGESIWLGFFLYDVLMRFAEVATIHDDRPFAMRCQTEAAQLQKNIDKNGWDGEWYRRAYFDDGTPLGSAQNAECQIDSISQSWSVLSGGGYPERARTAMQAVDRRLVRRQDAIIQLLDPPFDKSDQNPGYIRGYVPGVRENGGQYTHAAIWTVMAFAQLGDNRRAWELLQLINPVNHSKTADNMAVYKVEPYVIAADVYAVAPHVGRGGWTWYTGSAGWMYRLIIESLLGLRLAGDKLHIKPCLPEDWDMYRMDYRYRETTYKIIVRQGRDEGATYHLKVDGIEQTEGFIPLMDDQREHAVEMLLPVHPPP